MTILHTKDNAGALAYRKIDPTAENLYYMHRFGPSGGLKIINAADNTPLSQILTKDAIAANPELAKQTVGNFKANAKAGFGATQPEGMIEPAKTELRGEDPDLLDLPDLR
jgi:hypothetical protein